MFISFGMYIVLIIAVIIMIALIIYLTMTTRKSDLTPRKKYNPEKEAHAYIAHQQTMASHTLPFGQEESIHNNTPSSTIQDKSFSTIDTRAENKLSQQEDPSLQVLPYPKDDSSHD